MKKLSVSELIQVADLISDLPPAENGTSNDLKDWLDVDEVIYNNDECSIDFVIVKDSCEERLTALELLKSLGNWNAAVTFMMSEERLMYEDNVMPFHSVRMDGLSALMGYPSGHNLDPDADYEDYTESEYGIFFNSRNNIVWVDSIDGESEYGIAQFLDSIME